MKRILKSILCVAAVLFVHQVSADNNIGSLAQARLLGFIQNLEGQGSPSVERGYEESVQQNGMAGILHKSVLLRPLLLPGAAVHVGASKLGYSLILSKSKSLANILVSQETPEENALLAGDVSRYVRDYQRTYQDSSFYKDISTQGLTNLDIADLARQLDAAGLLSGNVYLVTGYEQVSNVYEDMVAIIAFAIPYREAQNIRQAMGEVRCNEAKYHDHRIQSAVNSLFNCP